MCFNLSDSIGLQLYYPYYNGYSIEILNEIYITVHI